MRTFKFFLFYLSGIIFIGCSNNNTFKEINDMTVLKTIPQKSWDSLSQKKIYFGHQSVGYNIMEGVEMILKENPNIKLNIKKGKDPELFGSPVFTHDSNGSNRDPISKIDDFCKTIENNLGDNVDIAGFKFCYVDFEEGTNVQDIFEHYKKKMNQLIKKYPKVKFVHFTVPIKSLQSGPKGFVKKIMGKDIGIKDNRVRQQFNELLLKEYKDQPVFDLAKAESTYPDGKREYTEVKEKKVYTLIPEYTNDGGHLSKNGKVKIGSELLAFLANLSDGRNN